MFQRLDHLAFLLERRAALVALAQVGLEGGDAKAHLAVQELVDFVGEKMAVIHGSVSGVRASASSGFTIG
jgi:hypothetical protein